MLTNVLTSPPPPMLRGADGPCGRTSVLMIFRRFMNYSLLVHKRVCLARPLHGAHGLMIMNCVRTHSDCCCAQASMLPVCNLIIYDACEHAFPAAPARPTAAKSAIVQTVKIARADIVSPTTLETS